MRLAVDDFGVGHASLRQLRALLPVDTLKIDKSFVDGITDDADDAAIVEGVVRLAHSLGLQAVAEGVETAEQVAMLRSFSCQIGQGYHFARPAEPDAIARMLDRRDSLRAAPRPSAQRRSQRSRQAAAHALGAADRLGLVHARAHAAAGRRQLGGLGRRDRQRHRALGDPADLGGVDEALAAPWCR